MIYDFVKQELDDSNADYLFLTELLKIYTVTFDIDMYSKYLDQFPILLYNGYGFGFHNERATESRSTYVDYKVFNTIQAIVLDFLNNQDVGTFLLYHCNSKDGRQGYRNKLFSNWFNDERRSNELSKYSIDVEIKKDDQELIHYVGFLTLTSNPNITAAILELDQFAIGLVNENINKI